MGVRSTDRIVPARLDSPEARPLVDDLRAFYDELYADYHGFEEVEGAPNELDIFPPEMFEPPYGGMLLILRGEETAAGGAFMYLDDLTAEVKRVWTSPKHRGEGLSRVVMAALEEEIAERGYRYVYLSTGPRQPVAKRLYLSLGYTPHFDLAEDPELVGELSFEKDLVPGNGGVAEHPGGEHQRELQRRARQWRPAPHSRLSGA